MFFCFLALCFNTGVEGGEAQSISGYDCSNPKNSEIWEASTRCKEQAEIELKEERGQVQLRDVKKMFARFSDNEKKGKNWYKVEPGVRRTRTLRQEGGFSLKHCDDEIRLYPEAEKHELDHIQGSAGPQLYRADIGAAGGWITMIQWLGWLIPVIRRTRRYIVRSQGRWQVEAAEGASLQH